MSAALLILPTSLRADDYNKNGKVKVDAKDKVAEVNRKAHEKICQGHHGTITSKTDNSVTIDGKQYAFTADTQVNKQGEALISKTSKVGDMVCFTTQKAADGSAQIAKLIAIDKDDKVRVRDTDSDAPSKVEVK